MVDQICSGIDSSLLSGGDDSLELSLKGSICEDVVVLDSLECIDGVLQLSDSGIDNSGVSLGIDGGLKRSSPEIETLIFGLPDAVADQLEKIFSAVKERIEDLENKVSDLEDEIEELKNQQN